jgi:hypothetical protein
MIMSIVMFMSRRVAAIGSLCMDMAMVVAVSIAKRMFMSMNMGRAGPRAVSMDVLRVVAMNPAIGVLMPVHMGVGLANAIGVNMLRLVMMSRSAGVVMLTGRTGAAGMNMFMLMSVAMGAVMAMIMEVALTRAVVISMVMVVMVTGVGLHIKQRRLDAAAASTMPADQARDAIAYLLSKCEPPLQNCPSANAKIARLQAKA